MKKLPIFLAGFVGVLAGLSVGYVTIPKKTPESVPVELPADANSFIDPKSASSDLGGNVRIAHFFTALKEPIVLRQRASLFEALNACTSADMPGLIAQVQTLPHIPRWDLMPMVLKRWFQLDTAAASEWVRANRDWLGMSAWAEADPQSVIREASSLPYAPYLPRVLTSAIADIAPGDPAAQAAALAQVPAGPLRTQILELLVHGWSKTDPALAYASLEQLPLGKERDETRIDVLRNWAERDPNAALAQVDALLPTLTAGVLGNELVTRIVEKVGEKNSTLALEWITKLPAEFRAAPAISVARIWAEQEPEAALEWCMTNGVDVARGHRGEGRIWGAGVLGQAIAAKPEATISWIQSLPAGTDRDLLLEKGLDYALWRKPRDLLFAGENPLWSQIFQQLPEEGQVRVATDIANQRIQLGDLTDLGSWLQNFSSPAARAKAIVGAFNGAYIRDATKIEPLLASISSTSDRDVALNVLVKVTISDAPAAAANRALAINDEARRREALDLAVTSWQKRDPTASRTWLEENTSIPVAWKAKWLQVP